VNSVIRVYCDKYGASHNPRSKYARNGFEIDHFAYCLAGTVSELGVVHVFTFKKIYFVYYFVYFSTFYFSALDANEDVIMRRNCDHFVTMCADVCMCVCVRGYVCQHDKTKTPDRTDLKLGTVVVLVRSSMLTNFGFKRSRVRVTGSSF